MNPVLTSSNSHVWQTPASFLELVRAIGPIALDPCTSADNPTGALLYFAPSEGEVPRHCTQGWCGADGLAKSWVGHSSGGLVFVNPPYGRALRQWANKCTEEARLGAEIVALVPARTDTRWFQNLWEADALLFWEGRIKFVDPRAPAEMMWNAKKGVFVPLAPAAFPSAVAYWGPRERRFREAFAGKGRIL